MITQWPKSNLSDQNHEAVKSVTLIQEIISEIRKFRNDQGIKTTAKVAAKFSGLSKLGLAPYEAAIRLSLIHISEPTRPY